MSNSAFIALWFSAPFLVGIGVTLLLRVWFGRGGLWAALAGLGLAVGFVLLVYFSSPRTYPPGTETELYLGRYWEPQFVETIAGGALVFWLMGVGLGVGLTTALALLRSRRTATREHSVVD